MSKQTNSWIAISSILLAVVVVHFIDSRAPQTAKSDDATQARLVADAERARQVFQKSHPGLIAEIKNVYPSEIVGTVHYAPGQISSDQVVDDSEELVHDILRELIADGHQPATELFQVAIWSQQEGLGGETRNDLVQVFGRAEYEPLHDRIIFKPEEP